MDNGKGREKIENESLKLKLQEVAQTVYFKTFALAITGTIIVLIL